MTMKKGAAVRGTTVQGTRVRGVVHRVHQRVNGAWVEVRLGDGSRVKTRESRLRVG